MAQGLAFLHERNVLHLDIKPDNLYFGEKDMLRIGDFGLAYKAGEWDDWEEGDGNYLAPELLSSARPTTAADIYSLGATLYECATGAWRCHSKPIILFRFQRAGTIKFATSPAALQKGTCTPNVR